MNDNSLWLVSFILSSTFAFLSAAFVAEIVIGIFRIKNHRTRSIIRLLPLLNLVIDFFFTKISSGHFLNPLYCESCIQRLILSFDPELKQYLHEHQIAWSKYLATQLPEFSFGALLFGFMALTCFIVFRKLISILVSNKDLDVCIQNASLCRRNIENRSLAHQIAQNNTKILVTNAIEIPMAAYLRTILIPRKWVENLAQDEFEAVVAHELEHLRWKDPVVKPLCHIGASLFWWIPTRWWLKKMDQDVEMASDASIRSYRLDEQSLASALFKIADERHRNPASHFCAFGRKEHSLLVRLQVILDPATPLHKKPLRRALVALSAGSMIALSCMI